MRWVGAAAALGAALLLSPVTAQADVLVTISKASQQMDVSIDGVPAYHWTVSTGRPGYDTPAGSFRAIRLERVYFSKKFDDAPMPNSVFFYGGYAVHGTLEEKRLGNPVSHGCVRLARPNAATLFALVQQHGMHKTRIVVVDGIAPRMNVPVARLSPSEEYRGREWHGGGYSRSFVGRRGDRRVVDTRRAGRHSSGEIRRTRPVMREVVIVRRPARYSGFDW